MPKTAICLKVPKHQGQLAIALVNKLQLIDRSLGVQHDGDNICLPLLREPQANELEIMKMQVALAQLTTSIFTEKRPAAETLTHVLENKLPPHLMPCVPQAFDVIGDIVIVEIPPQLKEHETLIGQAILETNRNIKTVLAKAGAISGVYRTREYIYIAGEKKTETIHREFGCQYHVDVAKAYFSPRLSHEHERVASLVRSSETVVDLFAGVGPFAVLIGKRNPNVKVYAVDLNPEAVELLKMNVRVNRVENRVFPICGDAREIAAAKLKGAANQVIMNLPETAMEFVDAACNAIKPQGGVVHFYAFVRQPDSIEGLQQRFSELVAKNDRRVEAFLYARSIRETAPYESQVVLDSKIV